MPLQKLLLKPGVNRENTRYTSEGGWYESDKVRFRQGMPEKIGGWERISANTFLGICRSLHSWVTLVNLVVTSVGTHLKYNLENGGAYYDITPLRDTLTLSNPFTTVSGSATVTVTDANGGYKNGDFVTFSNASAAGGLTLNGEFQITFASGSTYTITAASTASSSATGGGTVTAAYQINTGVELEVPLTGWSAGTWGEGTWGNGGTGVESLRIWSQGNFGEDLILGFRGSPLYFWDASDDTPLDNRATLLSAESGASDVPTAQNIILVSDINRFVFCFGANTLGTTTQDPMLIRWSDQENAVNWTPTATTQAGDLRLSRGSEIIAAEQTRQELLVWTDFSVYSLQYVGAPVVWAAQLVGENASIMSQNSVAVADNVAYWFGKDKFYMYDGGVKVLPCNVKRYIFDDINRDNIQQIFGSTNEGFDEIWWFYPSASSNTNDRYVVYNYVQKIWYYGTLSRTAWLDSGIRDFPLAATNSNNLVQHEVGLDDAETGTTAAITASITSAQFDLDDGHKFMLVSRMIPDVTFDGSTADAPIVSMSLSALQNSGSGFNDPLSESGNSSGSVTRTATSPVEKFTEQIFLRVRGRQVSFKVESTAQGVTWQLGSPRIDMRPDGRR
tara:strand:- start:401 stop:2251 length:1851 start_codon:yes stop_codon:yes gene_type:complete